jgi:hypothetical protein
LLFFSSLLRLLLDVNLPPVSVALVHQEKSRAMGSSELKSHPSITTRPAPGAPQLTSSMRERDDAHLQRMGKKPVLKVQSRPPPPPPPPQEDKEKTEGKKKRNRSDQIC